MNADFKINGKVIETDRLILRSFVADDLDDFYEYASVDGVGENAGWLHHTSKDETLEILNLFIEHDKVFALYHKNDCKVIGSLGVEKYKFEDILVDLAEFNGRELGFVLSKDYWGQGLMAEAVNAVVDYLFNELDLDFLMCGYYDYNRQSKRVQEKCGFKPYIKQGLKTKLNTSENSTDNILINPKMAHKFELFNFNKYL